MDPEATLEEMLALAKIMREENDEIDPADADRLGELVLAMHDWIRKGGTLPVAWTKKETK